MVRVNRTLGGVRISWRRLFVIGGEGGESGKWVGGIGEDGGVWADGWWQCN